MIPKKIHYCWFGGNPLPEEALRCKESWKKYCPDYEIKEWNEQNFDTNTCYYTKEAANERKWAFVSDYVRFKVLYEEGGLYFDTDVELISSIDDIIKKGPFMGCEAGSKTAVAPGLGLAASPGLGLYKTIIDYYNAQHFLNADGSINNTTVAERVTDLLRENGFKGDGTIEYIKGVYIYPPDYFCPMDYWTGEITITGNTRSIHHYSMSWKSEYEKKLKLIERYYRSKYGNKAGMQIYKIVTIPSRFFHYIWMHFSMWF